MKKFIPLTVACVLLVLTNCKSKQKATEPAATTNTADASTKNAGELQMEIAGARWPGTVSTELKEGQNIYSTKCTQCHKAYKIEKFSEKKWLHEIDDMSPKAKLNPDEKLKLTKYILSYRETKEKLKVN